MLGISECLRVLSPSLDLRSKWQLIDQETAHQVTPAASVSMFPLVHDVQTGPDNSLDQ